MTACEWSEQPAPISVSPNTITPGPRRQSAPIRTGPSMTTCGPRSQEGWTLASGWTYAVGWIPMEDSRSIAAANWPQEKLAEKLQSERKVRLPPQMRGAALAQLAEGDLPKRDLRGPAAERPLIACARASLDDRRMIAGRRKERWTPGFRDRVRRPEARI